MKRDQIEKGRLTKEANFKRWAEQTIPIDSNWQIIRADDYNWEIQHKGKFYGFYGNLLHAFKALPAKMLGEVAKNSLADVIANQNAISATIEKVLSLKFQ